MEVPRVDLYSNSSFLYVQLKKCWNCLGSINFIHAVDPEAIVTELTHKGIITAAHQEEMSQSKEWTAEQNRFLYDHLLTTSTKESFLTVYGIIKAVPGNPRMKHLG